MKTSIVFMLCMILFCSTISAQNLLNIQDWTPGDGDIASFTRNGSVNENLREWGIAPDGSRAVLWKAISDGNGDADGGWRSADVPVNPVSMYRFTVWIKKIATQDGGTFFGCQNVNGLDGTLRINTYFWHGNLPQVNKWYLLVGYIHGSEDTSTVNYGGIYDGQTGQKMVGCTDFKFAANASIAYHRSYQYYCSNPNTIQYFYAPRLEMVTGNEPSLSALLGIYGNGSGGAYFPASLGVGTSDIPAGFKLAVGGKAIAEEIKVKLKSSGWPDYVFDSSYQLTPLPVLETFIKTNKHLPDIPSAATTEKDGVDIGAMQRLLLKKIEELTLHLIELEKIVTKKDAEVARREAEIRLLKKR